MDKFYSVITSFFALVCIFLMMAAAGVAFTLETGILNSLLLLAVAIVNGYLGMIIAGASNDTLFLRDRLRLRPSVEKGILQFAKLRKGRITSVEMAVELDYAIEQSIKDLNVLANSGLVLRRIAADGSVVYCFPGLETQSGEA
ncbi:MAG: hypothetical protein G3M78_04350 [Candidatus Nitrohelix vancouverensis]|uniref:Uncharacterized protein n=1 Tax=Candidatus Nitrohelix vancouverensis TaxID=2705534 RepID=A0A7T0C187_9BACT|nr:MAG: hypothetical protein G3M78_04350 [Candidatus Nitrohelix vancouverensis]